MSYTFTFNGYNFGTPNKEFKEVAKDIKINQPLGDDVFGMPNQELKV